MSEYQIDRFQVSRHLGHMFLQMIFDFGFVHCDPHAGNILLRHHKDDRVFFWKYLLPRPNFQLVLLDHGLYHRLDSTIQTNYANVWQGIIHADEVQIEQGCRNFLQTSSANEITHHRLFASMLSGRTWESISTKSKGLSNIVKTRNLNEKNVVHTKVGSLAFLKSVNQILSELPRDLLLILKTQDTLRAIDYSLGVQTSGHLFQSVILMGRYCNRFLYQHESRGWIKWLFYQWSQVRLSVISLYGWFMIY